MSDLFYGDFITAALNALDRPASWLAKRLNVNETTVSRWISGQTRPTLPNATRIADVVNMTIETREQFFQALGYQVQIIHTPPQIPPSAHNPSATKFVSPLPFNNAPPPPALFLGREHEVQELKTRLGVNREHPSMTRHVFTAVRGWPGVGKTSIAVVLAHDPDIATSFSDGVLWVSLGPTPHLLSELAQWGRILNNTDLLQATSVRQASAILTTILRDKRVLLILDDVWHTEHATPFQVTNTGSAVLLTTRLNEVADQLALQSDSVYKLDVLSNEMALQLLQTLAPQVVGRFPVESINLVQALEALPLAIHVAGHLLRVEFAYGLDVAALFRELQTGIKLLEAKAPVDRVDLATGILPSVAVLLEKSTERLDSKIRNYFAYLGAFAPKPATFDWNALRTVWQVSDPAPIVRILLDRGLLEPVAGQFQMHALLVAHARSLLTD